MASRNEGEVRVAFTLREGKEGGPPGIRLMEWLHGQGFHDISEGRATVSASIGRDRFRQIFGADAVPVSPRAPGPDDFGAPGGMAAPEDLAVPPEIAGLVRAVGVVPPATRLKDTPVQEG